MNYFEDGSEFRFTLRMNVYYFVDGSVSFEDGSEFRFTLKIVTNYFVDGSELL